jgi:hypothetical protein
MDTSEVKINPKQEADNSAGLLQLDQRSITASLEEDRLAAGIFEIGLQARKLSGAQWMRKEDRNSTPLYLLLGGFVSPAL